MTDTRRLKNFIRQTGAPEVYSILWNKYNSLYRKSLRVVSPVNFAKFRYRKAMGRTPDLLTPGTFNEKLLWLMLYWRHPLKTECGDKYTMRLYVQEKGWGQLLPELLGVYNHSREIDIDALPAKFVLKCTHGCGFNIICENKPELNIPETLRKLDAWMATDYSKFAGELHYAAMKPRILCEKFLDEPGNDLPVDYKVYCFSGKAHCTLVVQSRDKEGHSDKLDFYDREWKSKLPYYHSSMRADRNSPKPEAYEEIIAAAEALSEPFPFVRMDFYSINGKAVLGEMTFTPSGCIFSDFTEQAQKELGALIKLPPRLT